MKNFLIAALIIGLLISLWFNWKSRIPVETKGFQFGRDSLQLVLKVKWTTIDSANLPKVHTGNPPIPIRQSDSTSTESTGPTSDCSNYPSDCITWDASHRPPISIHDPRFFILKEDKFIRVQPTYSWQIITKAATHKMK